MMRWFRRHQAKLLAVAVGMLMLSWGFGTYLTRFVGRKSSVAGWIHGKAIYGTDLQEATETLRAGLQFGFLDPQTAQFWQRANGTQGAKKTAAVLASDFHAFVFQEHGTLNDESVWRCLVLMREAEAEGVSAAPIEAGELLAIAPVCLNGSSFDGSLYDRAVSQFGLTEPDVVRCFTHLVSVAKLIAMRRESVLTSEPETWARYYYQMEKRKLRFVDIPAVRFLPLVEYDPDELAKWYDDHRNVVADPEAGVVGYMAPRRVRMECALAPMDRLQEGAVVTGEEAAAYYDAHKEIYRDRETAADGEDAAEKEPRYKPLEDVRGEIIKALKQEKALKAADELIDTVVGELTAVAADYVNEPLPLAQMARRHGLDYRVLSVESGRQFVSREELASLLPDGRAVASFAFDEAGNLHEPTKFSGIDQPLLCQLLEAREPEPQPYAEVEEQVRHDYGMHAALKSARSFAEKLRDAAASKGLAAAATEMAPRLQALTGVEGEEAPLLVPQESEEFTRAAPSIEGVPAGGPDLVKAAFEVGLGRVGMAAEGPPADACFVFEIASRDVPSEIDPGFLGLRFRVYYLLDKQGRELQQWFDSLLADTKRPERAKE